MSDQVSRWEAVGLTETEYDRIVEHLGREPNDLELGLFGLMWSEHCSYKSSRKVLASLPTEDERVLQGPGENAGVVDIGEDEAVAFRIESHNHPSAIEPFQGAATGIGGILRDIFTMGPLPCLTACALVFCLMSVYGTSWKRSSPVSASTETVWGYLPWAERSISTKLTERTHW